ncbi:MULTISPECIES: MBL fold metallo-hydrolase [unclassified Streptomyces]|uniref:MBL fold metallo-hydrolase n=1 Tax=unclassified Streptomyces TaxID=2593676 RepID=UPI0033B89F8A
MSVYTVKNLASSAFLVTDENGAMIVDTGVAGRAPAMLQQIADAGLRPTDVNLIVLTHHHADHSGSALDLRAATGAPIAIHRDDADQLRRGGRVDLHPTSLVPRLMKVMLAKTEIPAIEPDIILGDEEDLARHGGIGRSFVTPGHTPGSVCVLLPDHSIVAGDALSGGIMRARTARKPMFATDLDAAGHSMRVIAGHAPTTVYVGHGGHLTAPSVASLRTS